jgi:anhydro-N-acetylmuramic acid kinase
MSTTDQPRLIAGAMSGTSGDGIDVAIVQISGSGLEMKAKLLQHHHLPYAPSIRELLFAIRDSENVKLADLAHLGWKISLAYARAVNETLLLSRLSAADLIAVAAHGQTLYHNPPETIQWFDPSLVASEVGCPVVSDFRRADCAQGGQGAPLVPFADFVLFRDPKISRAVVNIGGIANITCLPAGAGIEKVIAFDTGPGNCISDYLMRSHRTVINGVASDGVDVDGALAASGKVDEKLFNKINDHPYFMPLGPKSTDGPAMIKIFNGSLVRSGVQISLADQLATACEVTAFQISRALALFGEKFDGELIVSGGGIRNPVIMSALRMFVGKVKISDEFGVPSEAKEAIAFALLGAATLDGFPSNVPTATGAARPVVLGSVTPKP